jgi:signal transduction histidine kinase
MQLGLRMAEFPDRASGPAASRRISLWIVLRGGVFALLIIFALSTQLLFQFDLYENWTLPDILLGWLDHFIDQLIVGACIFAAVSAAFLVPVNSRAAKFLLLLISITLGALAGEALLLMRMPLSSGIFVAGVLFAKVARWLVIGGLAYAYFIFQQQAAEAATQTHEADLQRIQFDRQMIEARVQSLRAQIEPHFLFNTLANVQHLYRTQPERARRMLGNFVAYLRAALPQMRHNETTLVQEIELARAYLEVLQVRMGNRLRVNIDIPEELTEMAFPPFALSTLTENAIKHGLNPLPEGGAIEIIARTEDGSLRVSVADTGAGLQHNSGTGAGIANLRARLAALYGDRGTLTFKANVPRGIRATIVVPLMTPEIRSA